MPGAVMMLFAAAAVGAGGDVVVVVRLSWCYPGSHDLHMSCRPAPNTSRVPARTTISQSRLDNLQRQSSADHHGDHPSDRLGGPLPGAGPSTPRHHPRGQGASAGGLRDRSEGRSMAYRQATSSRSPQRLSGSSGVRPKPALRSEGRQMQHGSSRAHGRQGPPSHLHERERQAEVTTAPYSQQSGYPS